MTDKLVMVSGGFDPLHLGHLNLFTRARALGTSLAVIVNGDGYVGAKHPVLMPQRERAEIIRRLDCVDFVVLNGRDDGDVSDDLRLFKPRFYVVGPDHADPASLRERAACDELRVEVVALTDVAKEHSSSVILNRAARTGWANPPVTASLVLWRTGRLTDHEAPEALLARRGQADGRGKLQLVGGFLEPGETLEGCVRREAREEVGLRQLTGLTYESSRADRYSDGRAVTAAAFWATSTQEPEPSAECPELLWVDRVPDGAFFCESDRQALATFFKEWLWQSGP